MIAPAPIATRRSRWPGSAADRRLPHRRPPRARRAHLDADLERRRAAAPRACVICTSSSPALGELLRGPVGELAVAARSGRVRLLRQHTMDVANASRDRAGRESAASSASWALPLFSRTRTEPAPAVSTHPATTDRSRPTATRRAAVRDMARLLSAFQRLRDLARGVSSRQAGDRTARMGARAAQEQAVDRRPILRPSERSAACVNS